MKQSYGVNDSFFAEFNFDGLPSILETAEEDIDLTDLSDDELDDFINGNLLSEGG